MPAKAVAKGQEFQIKAKHDTYGISFEYEDPQAMETKVCHSYLLLQSLVQRVKA